MPKKQFKDPIYEYIEIDSRFVKDIIDTPAFQRLKDIRQTSYTPLYPAAHHNRYVHSLGVYHLGHTAFEAIEQQLRDKSKGTALESKIGEVKRIFELACLLHDIGHAPFSHTGEAFYIDEDHTLYNQLKSSVGDKQFSEEFEALGTNMPAPHECMSCVVGLRTFSGCFQSAEERSLFARCIIGMQIRLEDRNKSGKYDKEYLLRKRETELLNCVISLLNFSTIDVDRLDYIIRDSTTIGFKNAQVDYMRLLKGMRIVKFKGALCIGYHKSALSVIESAIYAHDAEKKWVQSHPSILYEMEALKDAMTKLTNIFASETDPNPLLCYDSLTERGKTLKLDVPFLSKDACRLLEQENLWSEAARQLAAEGRLLADGVSCETLTAVREYPISLLADEDVLYLMKQFCKEGLGYEYFARNRRRAAVWKSEAEFRALFQARIGDGSGLSKELEGAFEGLAEYCREKTGSPIIDSKIFSFLDQEEEQADESRKKEEIPEEVYEDVIRGIKSQRHWAKILEDVSSELDIELEFLIVFQKKFNSSFKEAVKEIPIFFPNVENGVVPLKDVIVVLQPSAERKTNFFHLFYRAEDSVDEERKKQIVNTIAKKLIAGAASQAVSP